VVNIGGEGNRTDPNLFCADQTKKIYVFGYK